MGEFLDDFMARTGAAAPREMRALLIQLGIPAEEIPVDPGALQAFVRDLQDARLSGKTVEDFLAKPISVGSTASDLSVASYTKRGEYLKPPKATPQMRSAMESLEQEIWTAVGRKPDSAWLPINEIADRSKRRSILDRMRQVMHLDETVGQQGIGEIVQGTTSSYYSDIVDPAHKMDWASVWYQQASKQLHTERLTAKDAVLSDAVDIGGRQPSLASMDKVVEQIATGKPPKSYAVIDIETSGLPNGLIKPDIWQVAVRGSNGRSVDLRFRAPTMEMGTVRGGTLADALQGSAPISDFGEIKQALQILSEHEGIVGQNISDFDLPILLDAIGRHAGIGVQARAAGRVPPNANPEMIRLYDDFKAKIASNKVYDTLELGSWMIDQSKHPLQVAPELLQMGGGSPSSMQNVLLQTNLLELAQEHHGLTPAAIQGHLADTGLHNAYLDTLFEQIYYKEIAHTMETGEKRLQTRPEGFRVLGDDGAVSAEGSMDIRRALLERRAMTPYTHMGYSEVSDPVMELLQKSEKASQYIQEYDFPSVGKVRQVSLSPVEHAVLESRLAAPQGITEMGSNLDVGTIIQRLRDVRKTTAPVNEMLTNTGSLRKDLRVPGAEEYSALQRTMFESGIPHSNLHFLERLVSQSMMSATQDTTMRTLHGDLIPHSRFYAPEKAMIFPSHRLALPPEELRAAGLMGEHDMLRLNPFSPQGHPEIAVSWMFDTDPEVAKRQAEQLIAHLREHQHRLFLADSQLTQIEEAGTESLTKFGVQVGTMTQSARGGAGETVERVRRAHNLLVQAQGGVETGQGGSSNIVNFSVGMLGPTEDGTYEVGPAVMEKGMEGEQLAHYFEESKKASALSTEIGGQIANNDVLRRSVEYLSTRNEDILGVKVIDWANRASEFYKANKFGARVGLAAAALTAGFFFKKKREKNQSWYDQPFQQQPLESNQLQSSFQTQVGHVSMSEYSSGSPDPLGTAGLVRSLDRNKVGHTQMGNNKNSHLFGG